MREIYIHGFLKKQYWILKKQKKHSLWNLIITSGILAFSPTTYMTLGNLLAFAI